MKLISLSASNFMPYKGSITVDFPTDPDRNVMLVFGDNMRGKTSLLNAVRWALYGKALGRHSREIPVHDILNTDAALEGEWQIDACLIFEADGKRFELRRRATKRNLVAKPTRPEDFEISRHLRVDGIVVPDHAIDAYINRYTPEQVSRFFLFDGELLQEYESLLIEGSEQGKKIKDAIEQVLGVPALINGRDEAQTLLRASQKQQSKDLEKVVGLERQAERHLALLAKRDSCDADLVRLSDLLRVTRAERTELDDFIEKTEALHVAKVTLEGREARRKEIVGQQGALEQQRLVLLKDSWRELLRPQLQLKLDQLNDSRAGLTSQILARDRVQARIDQLQESLDAKTCPTCGQEVHAEHRDQTGVELGRLQAQIRGMPVDQDSMTAVAAEIRDISRLLRANPSERISAVDADLARLSVELTKVDNDIEKLNDQIRGQDTAEIARKRALRTGLLKEEGRVGGDISRAQAALDSAKKDLALIEKAIENIPAARGAKSTQLVGVYSAIDKLFSRSIDRLREDLKRRVETLATEAFKRLTTQDQYSALKINNNYGLMILDERHQEVAVRSAGAEQIVALSLIDGLARAGRAAGPVIMDTPFGRLDPKHRRNILSYLPTTSSQLILLVHEGEVNKSGDLDHIASRVGRVYEIREISPRHSSIEVVTQ